MFKEINKQKGYTIIETMIAVSLFIIIVMSGMGSLLNANLIFKKSQSMRSIVDSLSFAIEDMSRNIRTGSSYQCFDSAHTTLSPATMGVPRSCASGWAIAFEASGGNPTVYTDQWVYYISNTGKIFKSIDGASSFVQITPDEVVIDQVYGLSVLGAEPYPANSQQPFVNIRLVGHINFQNVTTPFSLETSASQRALDI